jgi:hypothetical protein
MGRIFTPFAVVVSRGSMAEADTLRRVLDDALPIAADCSLDR